MRLSNLINIYLCNVVLFFYCTITVFDLSISMYLHARGKTLEHLCTPYDQCDIAKGFYTIVLNVS